MPPVTPARRSLTGLSIGALIILNGSPLPAQQLSPDDAAALVLNAGRRAYNEQKFPAAAERFREFLKVAPNHKEAAAARYGLGLALLEAGDTKGALEALVPAAGADFPDKPLAQYQVGAVHRRIGAQSLAQIAAKPAEATALNTAAAQSFTAAATAFAYAAKLLEPRAKNADNANELSADGEWFVRARCDLAEMLLRTGKYTEAADAAWSVLVDPAWGKSRNRALASYHLGHADFQLKDFAGAGRELSSLAPFNQEFGPHARYLLGRTHHLNNELPEAGVQYKAVLAGYDEQKKAAQEALKNPAALTAEQKAAKEALVNQPPPEFVGRTIFYSAVLAFDEGKLGEAADQFAAFTKNYPKSPLAPEAQVRAGACLVQLRKFPEAIAALDPLKEHATLADQALTWLGRARSGGADPAKPAEYDAALNAALESLRKAAQRSQEFAKTDADAKARRPGILMELADTAVLAKQYKEAVTNYELIIAEKSPRAEEAMQRAVTAQHLAGLYAESDALAARFEAAYPSSTLLPAVLFRSAESGYLRAVKTPAKPEQDRLLGVAIDRYKRLVRKYPEFAYINQARQGLATAHYRLGNYTEAALIFATIPDAERTGELANVSYLLADCLIRTLPPESEDALQAERLIEKAEQAAKLLEGFVGAQEKSPQAPDALLKLGHCYQRVGALMAAPAERTKLFTSARDAYDRAIKLTDKEPTRSAAVFERAKCLVFLGDLGGAQAALTQFQNGPLVASPNAPMALLRLSTLLRAQGKAAEAATMMAQCRTTHEAKLAADPVRKNWVPQLQYEHALAVKESGKLPESRALFEALARTFPGQPEALNAQWRVGQCRREEGAAQLAAAREAVAKANGKPELLAPAAKLIETGIDAIRDAAESFQVDAEKLSAVAGATEAQVRMLYEGAWCHRLLAEAELDAAKLKAQREGLDKTKPAGEQPPADPAPTALAPAEQHAVEFYRKILATAPDSAVAAQARSELAELYSKHEKNDEAVDLLMDALEKSPATEVPERIRLGLAAAHLARKNPKQALACVQPIVANAASPNAAEARAIAAEALMQQQDWPKAIEQLVPFRDDQKLRSIANVSDRALLRLGHALAQAGQWDASRQTMEAVVQRYPQSPWVDEARYGIGWAWQNQKNFDGAVTAFAEVAKRTAAEVAAKAQLQIGLCRLDQKRFEEAETALLSVPLTYAYPEWSAAARCEAGRAQMELKKPDEAARNWQRVIKDYPKSPWSAVAQKNLAALK
ncbi:MAG TPA: tetratricopeptide repeat protein [Chthoniobacteraceae bacterium]|jgi:TolA-binding protein|nr:tetratricopeptide repeat protein [Chthoniobacteraceae bacterium]